MQRLWIVVRGLILAAATPTAYGQIPARGGFKAEITGVTIPADRRPVVIFTISDANGKALELQDLDAQSVKFTIAALTTGKNGAADCHNYVLAKVAGKDFIFKGESKKPALAETLQPNSDSGGAFTRLRAGGFSYRFATALPANFDAGATHVVGAELTHAERRYAANPLFEFVPNGGRVTAKRALAETASCNNCHDPMRWHRGSARQTGYCALCHTSQLSNAETGENLDFKYLIHKMHRGKFLSSVKEGKCYFTVGLNQRVVDFSTIVNPQMAVTETIPKEYRNCAACHSNPAVTNWKTLPSSVGCVSCHDNVDLRTGKHHSTGPAAEGTCADCHRPDGPEFGASIAGAHTFPGNASERRGWYSILSKSKGANREPIRW